MPNVKPIKTEVIDVLEGGVRVFSLDTSHGANRAGNQFADWWEDGLLRRAVRKDGDVLSPEDVSRIVNRECLDRYEFKRRYLDGERVVYPEDAPNARRDGYKSTVMGVRESINRVCSTAWTKAQGRIRADNKERATQFAITHASRYEDGLERVRALTAMDRLRDEISAVKDESTRMHLMAEYPELFDRAAADAMAEADRAAEQAELWRTAGGEAITFPSVE